MSWGGGPFAVAVAVPVAVLTQELFRCNRSILCEDYGCVDHWYEADGYFAGGSPPWFTARQEQAGGAGEESGAAGAGLNPDMLAAKARAEGAYMAINKTDPDAIWLYQGWILPGAAPFTEGLVAAVEPGRLVISDMRCEDGGPLHGGCEWDDNYAHGGSFYGAPFIWGTLHNFGGTLGMWGSLPTLATKPLVAFCNASTVSGVGMLPEGIDVRAHQLQAPCFATFGRGITFTSKHSRNRFALRFAAKLAVVHDAPRHELGGPQRPGRQGVAVRRGGVARRCAGLGRPVGDGAVRRWGRGGRSAAGVGAAGGDGVLGGAGAWDRCPGPGGCADVV